MSLTSRIQSASARARLLSVCAIVIAALSQVAGGQTLPIRRVLLLHQSAVGSPIRAGFDAAFVEAIRAPQLQSIELYEETLETARFPGPEQSRAAADYLSRKYAGLKMDAIVAQGMPPLDFARQHRDIFGKPPIVAVVSPADELAEPNDDVTGIHGGFWITGMMDLALALLPETQTVIVVDAVRQNAGEIERDVRHQLREYRRRLNLEYLRDLPLDDVLRRVASAPPDAIVLFVRQTIRSATQDVDQFDAMAQVARTARVPVFSQVEDFLGKGILGGNIWQYQIDARRVAQIASQIAAGASVRDVPDVRATYAGRVDWRELKRWHIPESRVPPGVAVLFRAPSVFSVYRPYVIGAMVVFAAQGLLIGSLLTQRVRRRRAEQTTREAQARNSAMLQAIPDLMFVLRRDGTYIDYHAKDPKLLFVPPEVFLGRTIRDIMPASLIDQFMEALERVFDADEPVIVEYSLPLREGRDVCHFETRLARAGEDLALAMVRDVTDAKRATALNRDLAGRLIASQEVERQRVARELHDDLSQKLALLAIDIHQLSAEAPDDGRQREYCDQIRELAAEIASDIHQLSYRLHPSKLETMGLLAAMTSLCRDMSHQGGVRVAFTHDSVPQRVDPNVSLCLYRIAQEALHNVARHSHAREAEVRLAREDSLLTLRVADCGVGFDPQEASREGLGLISMRERVAYLRGRMVIHSAPGGGTRIGVQIPLEQPAADEASALALTV
jgi:signal transduction histidine kinase/ABC-type uncharacterized transport system substrate-binding protein